MIRRAHLLVALTLTLVFGFAAPAFGWANGGDDGNGYGSHDWILDEALRLAGTSGSWVDRDTALLATDDPDSEGVSSVYHTFRETGTTRGGVHQVCYMYEKAVNAYKAGNRTLASKYLGQLSHYYSDICQPYHTAVAAIGEDTLHNAYELAVDDYQHQPGNVRSWITAVSRTSVSDMRARALSAAYYSRSQFPALHSAWGSSRSVGNATVLSITKAVQSRAVNDLADVIAAIPTGQGVSDAPAEMTLTMFRTYCAQNANAIVNIVCTDAEGEPIEGVGISLSWRFASGTVETVAFSGADGTVSAHCNTGSAPLMQWVTLVGTASGNGRTVTASTQFMPSPVLGEDTAGTLTTLSTSRPEQYSTVTATTLLRDEAGRPVGGLPVTYAWEFDYGTRTTQSVTNSQGMATSTMDVGNAAVDYRVYVSATTQSGGGNRTSRASFVTVAGTPPDDVPVDESAEVTLEDASSGVTFDRFVPCASSAYSGGTYTYGRWTGTRFECRFVGTKIAWVGPKQPFYGKADVYIDGAKQATVDCYAPAESATHSATIWESPALSPGTHTISICLAGAKNAASKGYVVVIDNLHVTGAATGVSTHANERSGSFAGSWVACANTTYTGGTYRYSRWVGAKTTYTFNGTKVAWIGPRSPFYGKAAVYIDGAYKATVSQYGLLGWRCRVWESGTLSRGTHTIEIRVLGTKEAASTSANVVVDGFEVRP